MHITTKDVVQNDEHSKKVGFPVGAHIITTVIEGDGAVELASDKAEFDAEVISTQRTTSGGIQVQVAVHVKEPEPETPKAPPTADDEAVAYFVSKGFTADAAVVQVAKFGAARVLVMRDADKAEEEKKKDEELKALLSSEGKQQ